MSQLMNYKYHPAYDIQSHETGVAADVIWIDDIWAQIKTIYDTQNTHKQCIGSNPFHHQTFTVIAWFDSKNEWVEIEMIPFSTHIRTHKQEFFDVESFTHLLGEIQSDFVVWDLKGVYLYVSPSAIKSPEIRTWIIGKDDFDYCRLKKLPISIAEHRHSRLKECIESKQTVAWQEEFTLPDGKKNYQLRTIKPYINQNQEVVYIIGYSINITELKTVATERNQLELRYKRIFQEGPVPIWVIDLKTLYFLDVNQAAIDKYGYSREAFLSLKLNDIRKEDESPVTQYYNEVKQKGQSSFYGEAIHYTQSSEKLWVEFYGIVFEENGREYAISTLIDNTEKKAFIEKIKAAENNQRLIMNASPEAIICVNLNNEITVWTPMAERVFGWKESEVLGTQLAQIILPEDFRSSFEKYFQSKKSQIYNKPLQLYCINKYDEDFPIELTMVYVTKEEAPFVCFFIKDITEQKRAKIELEQKNNHLEKLNSELDRFVYSTSHDLRAPLMSILGLIDLIEGQIEAGVLTKYLDLMKKSVKKLDDTIIGILEYSRNARLETRYERVEMQAMIDNIISGISFMDKALEIQFEVEINQSHGFYSDKTRIHTLLNNLITNSVKYSKSKPEGSFVKVRFHSDNEKGILTVSDNGEGIEADKLEKVFQMFYRSSVNATGSGLGLYICKEIVTKLGGEIKVTSEYQQGTTFTVELPNALSFTHAQHT